MTDSKEIYKVLNVRCQGGHEHEPVYLVEELAATNLGSLNTTRRSWFALYCQHTGGPFRSPELW